MWPENLQASHAFSRLTRQWQLGPMGHAVCLNAAAIELVLNAMQIQADQRLGLLDQLCVMEDAGASWLNRK